jgi:hypothetical protein
MNKKEALTLTRKLLNIGKKPKEIAYITGKSLSTIYRYKAELTSKNCVPELLKKIKKILLCGDLKKYIESLTFSELSTLRKKFKLSGRTKLQKQQSIIHYFTQYNILGIYPTKIEVVIS